MVDLKKDIQEGINSGIANDFEPKSHLKKLKYKRYTSVELQHKANEWRISYPINKVIFLYNIKR